MQPEIGSRNDDGTTTACATCGRAFRRVGQATLLRCGLPPDGVASSSPDSAAVGPTRDPRGTSTVYECPTCETRYAR